MGVNGRGEKRWWSRSALLLRGVSSGPRERRGVKYHFNVDSVPLNEAERNMR